MRLNGIIHVICLRREQTLHSQWLVRESQAPNALLSWGSSVLRAPALLQGKGVCAGRQPPASSAAHHPALCLFDIWMDLLLGLLGTEPSSLLLEPGVEHRVYVCVLTEE